jgi:tripartite-type tricarboxylate transporter receptor subunit TctC
MSLPRTTKLAACAFLVLAPAAEAAGYPTRPIRFVVPFPPGGGGDITARSVSQRLAENLGQSVVIDNRGGGSTIIGTDVVAKAPADGHTILIVTSTFAINPSLHPKLPYDSLRDLAPVTQLASTPYVVVVHPSLAATNIKELIALARAKPRQLSYASVGNGSATHLATEMFNAAAGTQITHVPYKGSGPALNDLVGGHVPIYFGSMPASMPQARAGRLRALAVTGATRSPAAPELPTIAEAGLPGYAFTSWYGVVAPGPTPRAIVELLATELRKVLEVKDVRDRLAADGSETVGSPPDAFAALIKADIARYARIVQQAGIRAD